MNLTAQTDVLLMIHKGYMKEQTKKQKQGSYVEWPETMYAINNRGNIQGFSRTVSLIITSQTKFLLVVFLVHTQTIHERTK